MNDTTQPPEELSRGDLGPAFGEVNALVLIWSRDEPARAGEALLIPADEPGAEWVFGRGGGGGVGELSLVRQRPGALEPTGALESSRISRAQLRLSTDARGALVVENLGRCPMIHEAREITRLVLAPGDLFELRDELVFLCARRPRGLPALAPESGAIQAFGAPDASGIVGEGPAIWELRRAVAALALRPVHALVLGPSGSGKELVARALHAQSSRAKRQLVARSGATIPEGLIDAELFGQAKNFPNPGSPERHGLVGEADGGTLFLDELAELPPSAQAHLLRVLDGGEYHRLGDARARRADLRFVGATNRPEQALKHDVLARLSARIAVPGLDARREDIPLLVAHLLRRQAAGAPALLARFFPGGDAGAAPRVTPDLITALVRHRYRTHLRELDMLLLRATLESRGKYVERTPSVERLLAEAALIAPPAAPEIGDEQPFTPEEQRRLALLRKHHFNPADCGRDPEYGASRQTADLHLRQLSSRALAMGEWDVDAAATILAGADDAARIKLGGRLEAFVLNLRRRLDEEGAAALRRSLASEWRASADVALRLIDAIEGGRIRGPRRRER
jgi:two-component system nitrogen regulation response regulator GlnG/two-component system response regulator HydG